MVYNFASMKENSSIQTYTTPRFTVEILNPNGVSARDIANAIERRTLVDGTPISKLIIEGDNRSPVVEHEILDDPERFKLNHMNATNNGLILRRVYGPKMAKLIIDGHREKLVIRNF